MADGGGGMHAKEAADVETFIKNATKLTEQTRQQIQELEAIKNRNPLASPQPQGAAAATMSPANVRIGARAARPLSKYSQNLLEFSQWVQTLSPATKTQIKESKRSGDAYLLFADTFARLVETYRDMPYVQWDRNGNILFAHGIAQQANIFQEQRIKRLVESLTKKYKDMGLGDDDADAGMNLGDDDADADADYRPDSAMAAIASKIFFFVEFC